jgi:hypothetical protein
MAGCDLKDAGATAIGYAISKNKIITVPDYEILFIA